MELDGSVALVTGGASGLGLATARALHGTGVKVVIVDLPQSAGSDAASAVGERCTFVPADVTDDDDIARAVNVASDRGFLRVVVNCAGIASGGRLVGRNGPMPLEDFRRVLDVNLVGTVNVMRHAADAMMRVPIVAGERGVIVNTSSIAAFDGQIGQTAYAASKAAIAGMTLPAARELAESLLRVVAIAPGTFETPMMERLSDAVRSSLAEQIPHPGRLGRPEEFAQLVLSVIHNPMLNGEVIRLDGALRMGPR